MATNQCNTCGGYESIVKCSFCPTMICVHCKRHHQEYCELLQKAKKRGEGPTVANAGLPPHRAGHEAPEPVILPTIFIPSAAPVESSTEYDKMWGRGVEFIPAPPTQVHRRFKQEDAPTMNQLPVYDVLTGETKDRVDVQIDAVKDLQNEISNPEEKI